MTYAYELIKQAVQNKHQVTATYKGHVRMMCPHALGWTNDRERALFYQFGGTSSTGLGPDGSSKNWLCIFLDELTDISVSPGAWYTAPEHSRPQRCVAKTEAEAS